MRHSRLVLLLILIILIPLSCKEKKVINISGKSSKTETTAVHRDLNPQLKEGTRGGSIIRADISEIDTFNVVTTRSKSLYGVLKLVFEGLLSINPYTGEIKGGIAKDYQIINNGFSILIHLNDNVYFSDGVKCTADDVVFSFEDIYLNPEVNSKRIDLLTFRNRTVKITKVDNFTLRIDLPVPYRPFLYNLTRLEILPEHILKPEIEKNGISWFNNSWGNPAQGIEKIIGTGPYKLQEYKKGKMIRLVRNSFFNKREGGLYLDGMPYLDEVIELLNLDNDSRLLKFQIGEIDFYPIIDTDFENGNFDSLIKNKNKSNYKMYYHGDTLRSSHFIAFNLNPRAVNSEKYRYFNNRDFRKAISMCINRDLISKKLYRGYCSTDLSPLRDISPYYKSEGTDPFDPDRAKKILLKLGLKDTNNDGILELPSGKPFRFTILTNKDNPFRIEMGNIILEGLKKAGLQAELSPVEYDLLITKLLDSFDWEAVIIGSSGSLEPNDLAWIWESSGPLHLWYPYQKKPATQWEKRIDELFSMGRTAWNTEDAKRYYFEFQDIAAREIPIINIVTPYQIYAFRNGYGNIFSSAATYNSIGIIPYIYQK